MDRFHKHKWLLGIGLVLLAGCKPEPPAQMERRGHEIELPAAFSDQQASRGTMVGEHDRTAELRDREIRPNEMMGPPLVDNSARKRIVQDNRFSPGQTDLGRDAPTNPPAYGPAYFGNFEAPLDPQALSTRPTPAPGMLAPNFAPAPSFAPAPDNTPAPEHATVAMSSAVAEAPGAAFHTVDVLYATDRKQDSLSLSESQFGDQRQLISLLGIGATIASGFFLFSWMLGRSSTAKLAGGMAVIMALGAVGIFATTMEEIEKQGVTYSGGRGELVRGVCRVTVPVSHTRGTVERPSLLKFEVAEDQAKHIVLTSVAPLAADEFEHRLGAELAAAEQPDLMVFIHGYNVGFESAVLRTAQIAVDLPFRGVPICYSWPSQGTLLGYPIDENNAAWTVGHLKQFLGELVDRSGAKSIHVVAHSMGNRAMTSALQQMAYQRGGGPPLFDRVVLAAPDVDADLFRKDLALSLTQIARQVTLYASSDDQALVASKKVHGYPRAGETGEHLVVVPGVETIDVSGIDLSLLGHSYYGESEPILRDLYDVLLSRLPAKNRQSLVSRMFQSQVYWQLATGGRIATGTTR